MNSFHLIIVGFLCLGLVIEYPVTVITTSPTCVSKQEAEKILGKTAQQTESLSEEKGSVLVSRCTWSAEGENGSSRASNLFFLVERYQNADAAHQAYAYILSQNENMQAQNSLTIGDEGWLHSDQMNFHFIMIRKGNKILRLKVNKVTAATSLIELKRIAADLTATL